MPVYLLHGFKWPREGFTGIRVHGIVRDLNNTSVNYIQNQGSREAFLASFREMFPTIMGQLEDPKTGKSLDFIEPYDPEDEESESAMCGKYAFVADRVITMAAGPVSIADKTTGMPEISSPTFKTHPTSTSRPKTPSSTTVPPANNTQSEISPKSPSAISHRDPSALFMNVEEAMSSGPAITPQAWEALAELRDQIAEGEKIGWWIVYNGDPARSTDADGDWMDDEESSDDEGTTTPTQPGRYSEFAFLDQAMPSLLPAELKNTRTEHNGERSPPPAALSDPQPSPEAKLLPSNENKLPSRHKQSKSFTLPLKKSTKVKDPVPRADEIPEPPALKEINKKEGFRHKFFGRRS